VTRNVIHALTPGDHYSPRTGSAVPTVVHGLASAAQESGTGNYTHSVLLDGLSMHPRYESAAAIEYTGAPYPRRWERIADALAARAGLPRRSTIAAYQPLARAIKESDNEAIVVAHNAPVLAGLLRERPGPAILYAHNDILRTVSRREAAHQLGGVASVVCVSEYLAEQIAARLPAHLAARVRVVENGVDTDQFSPAQAPTTSSARLRVLFLGRTIAEKGPDLLLAAARRLARDDIEFVIVGSYGFDRNAPLSTFESDLRKEAESSGAHVRFEPFVDRFALPALLRTADIFVAPSRWPEPSGLTLGEAMATGLPVITSRAGGIPEVVGNVGILIAPGDSAALASAIALLADSPSHRTALGQEARKRAIANNWSRSWRQFEAVLNEI